MAHFVVFFKMNKSIHKYLTPRHIQFIVRTELVEVHQTQNPSTLRQAQSSG